MLELQKIDFFKQNYSFDHLKELKNKIYLINELKMKMIKKSNQLIDNLMKIFIITPSVINIFYYIDNVSISHLIAHALFGLVLGCMIVAGFVTASFVFHGTEVLLEIKNKYLRFFKSFSKIENDYFLLEKQLIEMIENPITQKKIICYLNEIGYFMKNKESNIEFNQHFSKLFNAFKKKDYHYAKNDLLKNFDYWNNLFDNNHYNKKKNICFKY